MAELSALYQIIMRKLGFEEKVHSTLLKEKLLAIFSGD